MSKLMDKIESSIEDAVFMYDDDLNDEFSFIIEMGKEIQKKFGDEPKDDEEWQIWWDDMTEKTHYYQKKREVLDSIKRVIADNISKELF